MQTRSIGESPINRRGGQTASLLLAKGQFGSQNLAITWVDSPPGSQQPLHRHPDHEQVYVIVRGRGTMTIDAEAQEVAAGTLVFVPPGAEHAIRNDGPELLSYVSATAPPFDPADLGPAFSFEPPEPGA
jgi:mannose-6-phosphate isomerase-like protein (cupin superfamily)